MTGWKNLKIGKKISLGIGAILLMLILISAWSWGGINGIVNDGKELATGNKLVGILLQREVDHLNWSGQVNELLTDEAVNKLTVETDHTKCGFGKWYYGEGRKAAEAFLPVLKDLFAAIEEPHRKLHESAIRIDKVYKNADLNLPAILANSEVDHLAWSERVQTAILQRQSSAGVQLDHRLCAFGKMLFGETGTRIRQADLKMSELLDAIEGPHEKLHQTGQAIEAALAQNNFTRAQQIYINETASALTGVRASLKSLQARARDNLEGGTQARSIYATETHLHLSKVQEILEEIIKTTKEHVISEERMLEKAVNTRMVVLIISILAVLIGIVVTIFIAGSISGPIKKAVTMMRELKQGNFKSRSGISTNDEVGQMAQAMDESGEALQNAVDDISRVMERMMNGDLSQRVTADCQGQMDVLKNSINESLLKLCETIEFSKSTTQQVNVSAEELSQSAQSLAVGATEQAASLEEISSTMTEIADRAKQNDENAATAASISSDAIAGVAAGNTQMENMLKSMKAIDQNSSNVTRVIKVIDEIAFQTNLLALNAAVEAARAGKYGKGFAVVAEEVRNLAGRSAEAAKETNELIEKSVSEVSIGVKLADKTAEQLREISKKVEQVNVLIGEISAASKEQRISIEEINDGLSTMNGVVQQNSSISEETASASEELSSQSTELQNMMNQYQTDCHNDHPGQAVVSKPRIHRDTAAVTQNKVPFNTGQKLVGFDVDVFEN